MVATFFGGPLLPNQCRENHVGVHQPRHGTIFFPSHLLTSPFFSLSLLVGTQIRGHMAGPSPPSPLRFVPCIFFIARRFQLFLPSLTPVELCLPTLRALSS